MKEEFLNPNSVDFIGSSGTLVAAALETVGYYYQSILMDALSRGVAGSQSAFVSLGALFFVIGAIVALVNVIALGKYKFSAWLLIGPVLFYACVFSRVETSGSAWKFGGEERSSELLEARVEDTLGREGDKGEGQNTEDYKPKVAGVFAWYNKIISSTVGQIVKVINGNKSRVDTSFFVRTQMYNALGGSLVEDPGLNELVHEAFFGQCRKQIEYGRKMRDLRYSNEDRVFFADRWGALARKRAVEPKALAKEYIGHLYAFYPALFAERIVVTAEEEKSNALSSDGEYRYRVWDDGVEVHERKDDPMIEQLLVDRSMRMEESKAFTEDFPEAEKVSIEATTGRTDAIAGVLGEARTVDQVNEIKTVVERDGTVRDKVIMRKYKDVEGIKKTYARLNQARSDIGGGLFKANLGGLSSVSPKSYNDSAYTCHEIWQLVYVSLHWQGLIKLRQTLHQGVEVSAQAGDQIRFLHDMMVSTRYYKGQTGGATSARDLDDVLELEDIAVNAIAKKLFKNEARRGSISARIAALTASVNRNDHVEVEQDSGLEELEELRLGNNSWQEKVGAIGVVQSMPYYQGIILYFLAVLFPFFALLLIIPGKHSGFFLWFILWFWAKSWDIGFAIIMMLDDVLHAIFVQGLQASGASTGLERELSLAALSLQEQDPTFQPAVYYTIMNVAFKSIPIVTSYFIIGALKGGGGIIAEGMNRYTTGDMSIGRMTGIGGVGRAVTAGGSLWNIKAEFNQRRVDGLSDAIKDDQGGAAGLDGGRTAFRSETGFLRSRGEYFGKQMGIGGMGSQYAKFEGRRGFGDGMSRGARGPGIAETVGLAHAGVDSHFRDGTMDRQLARYKGKKLNRRIKGLGQNGTATQIAQGVGKAVSQWYDMKSETNMRSMEARIGLVTTWMDHDLTGSLISRRDSAALIANDSIPIYTTVKVDHMQEANRIYSDYANDVQWYEGAIDVTSTAVSTVSGVVESRRNRKK